MVVENLIENLLQSTNFILHTLAQRRPTGAGSQFAVGDGRFGRPIGLRAVRESRLCAAATAVEDTNKTESLKFPDFIERKTLVLQERRLKMLLFLENNKSRAFTELVKFLVRAPRLHDSSTKIPELSKSSG